MYTAEYMDPFGIHNPSYSDFLLLWDGKLNDGSCLTYSTVYNARLIIRSCDREFNDIIAITLLDAPEPSCNSIPGIYSTTPPHNCCPDHAIIDNVNYTADSRADVQNYIDIAQSGPITFANNVNVKFHAGNVINVGSNYVANPGANVEMEIVPCGTRMFANNDNDGSAVQPGAAINTIPSYRELFPYSNQKDNSLNKTRISNHYSDYDFIVRPNPNNGVFTIFFKNYGLNSKNVFVTDAIGNTIYEANSVKGNSFDMDLTSAPQGVYFIKVIESDRSFIKKMVKL
jgi:hypothetical protein